MCYRLPNHPAFREHHWADWVELLCIADPDGVMDASRVRQEARQQKDDLGEALPIDEGELEPDRELGKAERVDRWNQRVANWYAHLRFRARHLGAGYPFLIADGDDSIQVKGKLTGPHRLYFLLLMAANLNYFQSAESDLTASFEALCLEVFRKWMPAPAEILWFGANKLNKGELSGRLWHKIGTLAKCLRETVKAKESDFSVNDCGDHGLDLVARLPAGDDAPGTVLFFGQCACTTEWVDKQHSSSGEAWRNVMTLMSHPLNVIFIPFCLRNSDGTWHQPGDQRGHVMMDRFRLLHFLGDRLSALKDLPAFAAVEALLKTKVSLN